MQKTFRKAGDGRWDGRRRLRFFTWTQRPQTLSKIPPHWLRRNLLREDCRLKRWRCRDLKVKQLKTTELFCTARTQRFASNTEFEFKAKPRMARMNGSGINRLRRSTAIRVHPCHPWFCIVWQIMRTCAQTGHAFAVHCEPSNPLLLFSQPLGSASAAARLRPPPRQDDTADERAVCGCTCEKEGEPCSACWAICFGA
jgi:hypothetical protein